MIVYTPIKNILVLWLLMAAVGFYPIVIIGRIKLNNVLDLLLLFISLAMFLILINRIKISFKTREMSLVFIIFLISWIPGFAFSNNLDFLLQRYLIFGSMTVVVILLFLLPKPEKPLLANGCVWVVAIFFISALLVLSYIAIGVTEYGRVTIPGYDNGVLVYRYVDGVGLLPDPNVLSYGLGFIYILSLAYTGFRPIIFGWLALALLLVGSRSALLSLFIAMSYWFIIEYKFRKTYLPIFAVILVGFISAITFFQADILKRFQNPENYIERYSMWLSLLDAYLSSGMNILWGNGFGSARSELGDPHNLYLSVLYDGGFLALPCLFLVYFASFRYVTINFSSRERNSAYVMLVFNLLIGLFYWQDQMFFVPFLLIWLLSIYKGA